MPLTIGINHVTTCTPDLDRLVAFYADVFDADKVFEGPATATDARMAVVALGGTRYVKIVEDASATPGAASAVQAATERFGLAVGSHSELVDLRERMAGAGVDVGRIVRLPTQWVLRFTDPDGTPLQVCAHARPDDPT